MALLELKSVSLGFAGNRVLQDVNFAVEQGAIASLIGPNGAGKSSCFAAVTHAVRRDGAVLLAGAGVTGLPTYVLARRGLRRTFQQNAFFGELTLLENAMAAMLREHSTSLPRSIVLPWQERGDAPAGRGCGGRAAVVVRHRAGLPREAAG